MYLELSDYVRPETVEQCVDLLGGEKSAALGGGTYINVREHERIERLVDLQALPLRGISRDGGVVRVGALVTLSELVDGRETLGAGLVALVDAALAERNLCTRNRSTVGGRLARRRGDARLATALAALGAEVEVVSAAGARDKLSVVDYLGKDHGAHLVAGVALDADLRASGYSPFEPTAMESPVADAALSVAADGSLRLASGGHGPSPGRVAADQPEAASGGGVVELPQAAAVAQGIAADEPESAWLPRFSEAALAELPSFADDRGSAEYRCALCVTLLARLVAANWRAGTLPASNRGGGAQ